MSFDEIPTPLSNRPVQSPVYQFEANGRQTPRKEGLTTKLRQTIAEATGRAPRSDGDLKGPSSRLANLSQENQELVLRAVDLMKQQDSENIMSTLDESRDMLHNAFEEFKQEQDEYRRQLEEITQSKEAAMRRRNENSIPLSIFMRQKRDADGLADLRPNSSMNPKYQAYFEALLVPETSSSIGSQHPSDKAAVVKYIRRRERRKRAEENRQNYELTGDALEKQTADLIQKMEGVDVKMEHERQRQNELLRARMQEKKVKSKNMIEASEIMDQANEADVARQRYEQSQREKIEARLSTARGRHSRTTTPGNVIHVHSRYSDDDGGSPVLDEEQEAMNRSSLQLLNESGDRTRRTTTPVFGDSDANEKIPHINI